MPAAQNSEYPMKTRTQVAYQKVQKQEAEMHSGVRTQTLAAQYGMQPT